MTLFFKSYTRGTRVEVTGLDRGHGGAVARSLRVVPLPGAARSSVVRPRGGPRGRRPARRRAPAPAAASRLTADADRRDRLSVEIARAGPPDRAGWRSCFPGAPPAHAAARAALEPLRPGRISVSNRYVVETYSKRKEF